MNKKRIRRPLSILLGVVGTLVVVSVGVYLFTVYQEKYSEKSDEGILKAPNFVLPDASGSMVSLEDIDSKVVVINFWASWSPYSKDELSYLVALKKEYGADITIVGLNRDHNSKEGQIYLESLSLGEELVFVYDKNDEYFKKINGFAVPETIFLNRDGDIVAHIHGPASLEQMKEQVESILQ